MESTFVLNDIIEYLVRLITTIIVLYGLGVYYIIWLNIINDLSLIDLLQKLSTIVIAVSNLGFALYVYFAKDKKENQVKENDLKVSFLKTLVLDHHLKNFYKFFDDTFEKIDKLKEEIILLDEEKSTITDEINDSAINLRKDFIDIFLAVDINMYNTILERIDLLTDKLTEEIFNPDNDFTSGEDFREKLSQPLSAARTDIIKIIFLYRG